MLQSAWTWYRSADPVTQAALAGVATWLLTAAGAATVVFARRVPRGLLAAMLGFAAGVMLAASVWSLLLPAIDLVAAGGGALARVPWLPPALGFLLGGAFLFSLDKVLPHLHPGLARSEAEGPETGWRRATLLVLAITLHNVPEGLAVGVAFGAAADALPTVAGPDAVSFGSAVALALGIGLQNVPEGVAVALPLRAQGMRRRRSLWLGQLSAAVEPLAAAVGAAAVLLVRPILPYALAFAAGAMVFVVVEELVPESQAGGHGDLATASLLAGFTLMMVLDVALG